MPSPTTRLDHRKHGGGCRQEGNGFSRPSAHSPSQHCLGSDTQLFPLGPFSASVIPATTGCYGGSREGLMVPSVQRGECESPGSPDFLGPECSPPAFVISRGPSLSSKVKPQPCAWHCEWSVANSRDPAVFCLRSGWPVPHYFFYCGKIHIT